MHFPIICIEDLDTPIEDWNIDLDCEDSVLNYHTDYYGELYSKEERKEVINSDWLKELFDGIAVIDTDKETITICDEKTVRHTLEDYFEETLEHLYKMAKAHRLQGYDLRNAGFEYKGFWTLFYYHYGMTSLGFVEDAVYYARKTFKIGNIFDAHV